MSSYKNLIIGIVVTLILVFGGLGTYYLVTKNKTNNVVSSFPDNAKKGELGYVEQNSVLDTNRNGVYKGKFGRLEGINLYYYEKSGQTKKIILTDADLAIQCTDERFEDSQKYDLHLVKEVKVVTYRDLFDVIPTGTSMFILTTGTGESELGNTLVVPTSVCTNIK